MKQRITVQEFINEVSAMEKDFAYNYTGLFFKARFNNGEAGFEIDHIQCKYNNDVLTISCQPQGMDENVISFYVFQNGINNIFKTKEGDLIDTVYEIFDTDLYLSIGA